MESNVQKIREALELCVKQMCANCRDAAHTLAPGTPCVYGCETLKIAKAAISAPSRNCERFGDWDEAAAEYERLVAEGKVEDGTWGEWLFSTGPYAGCHAGNGAEAEGGED